MAITYDEPKRALNLQHHDFDFADFARHFDASNAVFSETTPSRTSLERLRVVGLWSDGRIVTAIVSPLGSDATDIVSVRRGPIRRKGPPMTHSDHAPGYVPNPDYTQKDWDEVSDNPPLTDEDLAGMRLGPDGLPPDLAAAFKNRGGRSRSESKCVPVSLRVDPDVLAAYKATGPGWQVRMNEALRRGMAGL